MNLYIVTIAYTNHLSGNSLEFTTYRYAKSPDAAVTAATAIFSALCNAYISIPIYEGKIFTITSVSVTASPVNPTPQSVEDPTETDGENTNTEGTGTDNEEGTGTDTNNEEGNDNETTNEGEE